MDQTQGEQQQATESDGGGIATRDELIEAVRAAGGVESVAAEQGVEPAAVEAAATEQPATPAQEEELRIEQILKQREEEHQKRRQARDFAQETLARAQQEADRIVREARERAEREAAAERDRLRQEFRGSPTATLRAIGDPQTIADAVAMDGTPEGRARLDMQRQIEEAKREAAEGKAARAEIAALKQERDAEIEQRNIERVQSLYFSQHATPEKTPYAFAEYGGHEGVWRRSDEQAREWQRKGLVLGEDFDMEQVALYVEKKAKSELTKKAAALGLIPAQQASAGAPAKVPGTAPQALANGSRTLPAAAGSERRTAPKPFFELPPDKQREDLIEAVKAAKRANPDAEF